MPDPFDLPFDPGQVDDLGDLIAPEGDDPTGAGTADPDTDNVVPSPFQRSDTFALSDLLVQELEVQRNVAVRETRSGNWQMDAFLPGTYIEGIGAIEQSMWIVLSTEQGTQPFAPTFGSSMWDKLDRPITTAGPLMAADIKADLDRWEPRIEVKQVRWSPQTAYGPSEIQAVSGIRFDIVWAPTQEVGNERVSSLFAVVAPNVNVTTGIYFILATDAGEAITTDDGTMLTIQ